MKNFTIFIEFLIIFIIDLLSDFTIFKVKPIMVKLLKFIFLSG
jgi:hypothetical protein